MRKEAERKPNQDLQGPPLWRAGWHSLGAAGAPFWGPHKAPALSGTWEGQVACSGGNSSCPSENSGTRPLRSLWCSPEPGSERLSGHGTREREREPQGVGTQATRPTGWGMFGRRCEEPGGATAPSAWLCQHTVPSQELGRDLSAPLGILGHRGPVSRDGRVGGAQAYRWVHLFQLTVGGKTQPRRMVQSSVGS